MEQTQPREHPEGAGSRPALAALSDLLGGDPDLIVSTLAVARQQLQTLRQELDQAVRKQDAEALHFLGHKLYGTAVMIGMDRLAALARAAEQLPECRESAQALALGINDAIDHALEQIALYDPET